MRRLARLAPALLAALLAGCDGGGAGTGERTPNVLSGTVRLNGDPVEFVMLVAAGPDGTEVSGPHLPGGRYEIENPPAGRLTFRFAAAPPDAGPPGGRPPKSGIPAKYFTARNDLSFEYAGGKQTYDIELKP